VLLASASQLAREELARLAGERVALYLLVAELAVDLEWRSVEVVQVAGA